ncbi:hypothetical protein LTR86_001044 [Recurvomyces mirabilis]|nr:hypothetical protein LTR86_001044 [Recurvomyces mirabilis]
MDSAEWPAQQIPDAIKRTLERFYRLIDSPDPQAGEKLARKVFAVDGDFVVNKRVMSGREQIANWHKNGESIVSREHQVDKIYVCNAEGDDLLMIGTLTMESDVGLVGSAPYTARCVIDDAASPTPKVRHWQFWLDPTPFFDLGIMRPPVRQLSVSGILDTIGGR